MCDIQFVFFFSVFTKSAHLAFAKEHLTKEVSKKMDEKSAGEAGEAGEAAEPVNKSPRLDAHSSLDSAFEEILQERESQALFVSTSSAEVQVQTYLSAHNL